MLAVAACTSIEPVAKKGEEVSFQQVMAETKGRPYACAFFEAETNSCLSSATYTVQGNSVVQNATAAFQSKGRTRILTTRITQRLQNGKLCATVDDVAVSLGGGPQAGDELVRNLALNSYRKAGTVCDTFYRAPNGDYVMESRNARGNLMPFGASNVRFTNQTLSLRPF